MHRQLRAGLGRGWVGVVALVAVVTVSSPAAADIAGVQPGSASVGAGESVHATVNLQSPSGACLSAVTADLSISITLSPVCGSGSWASTMTITTTTATLQASHLVTIAETPDLIGLPDLELFALTVTAPPPPTTTTTTPTTTTTTVAPPTTTTTAPPSTTSTTSRTTTTTTTGGGSTTTPPTTGSGSGNTVTEPTPGSSTTTTTADEAGEASATAGPPTSGGPTDTTPGAVGPSVRLGEAASGLFDGSVGDRAERLAASPWLILSSLLAAMTSTGAALIPFLMALLVLAALAVYRHLQFRRSSR